jgi:predicted dehydrogenase
MTISGISRRGFLSRSTAAMTAAGLPLWFANQYASAALTTVQAANRKRDANDNLQLGWIGIGSPQSRALQVYGSTRQFKQLRHVAVCDVDARHLYRAAFKFKEENDRLEPSQHSYYREVIDRDDIDIVVVATPDHWHADIAIAALEKGKDVYCEKPLTLTIDEALRLIATQKKTGRVLQTGSQQRTEFGGMFRLATEIVRSGAIGTVKNIECRIGANPMSGPIPETAPPAGLDWNAWLGPTPLVPYRVEAKGQKQSLQTHATNCHYNFRWFQAYSGGKMTDWGAHHIDIAQWCLGMDGSGPKQIVCESMSDVYTKGDGYDWPQDFRVKLTYDNGAIVHVMSRHGSEVPQLLNAKGESKSVKPDDNGVLIKGESGTVFVSRGSILASSKEILDTPPKLSTPLYDKMETNHFGNFLDCVASRNEPICSATVGGGSVIICHLGVIALQLGQGKVLNWDSKTHRFTGENADAANARLARPRRT